MRATLPRHAWSVDQVVSQAREAVATARSERDDARRAARSLQAERDGSLAELERSHQEIRGLHRELERADARIAELERALAVRVPTPALPEPAPQSADAAALALAGVIDQLRRALSTNPDPDDPWFRGTAAILASARHALKELGVHEVGAVGQPFDPHYHDAVGALPSADLEPDTLAGVLEVGLRTADRLLRPARVIVATGA